MKPRDKQGVVDSALNVYGVEGLKVTGKQRAFSNNPKPEFLMHPSCLFDRSLRRSW